MPQHVNLVKLCVGCESVDDLARFQRERGMGDPDWLPRHVTRMWPKREAELVAGGSLYWVVKGAILARQRILRLDEVIGQDGIRRCGIVMAREIHRTQTAPRRAFQGWRYLAPADAPADLPPGREGEEALPAELSSKLAEIGIF
ncbi:DUF1489 family protein [Sinisalibacter lacisalsi]|uniref:Lysophospholipase n=1 Tax=Sinisalibacter lacisalsi TaxID=1526570 RepID=A0ABQ1QVJ7_9RHOB|nr:DUF1489 domain-containing protein [Sinisalibacter lacisalsi]GGD44379.1 lysophospholipase [Sinisalibacter lacisalsi]